MSRNLLVVFAELILASETRVEAFVRLSFDMLLSQLSEDAVFLVLLIALTDQTQEKVDDLDSTLSAWRFSAIPPTNYKLTFLGHRMKFTSNEYDKVLKFANDVSKENSYSQQALDKALSQSNIGKVAEIGSDKPTKMDILVDGKSIAKIIYKDISGSDIVAKFSKNMESEIVYQNYLNKAYQIFNNNTLHFESLRDLYFVPYFPSGSQSVLKIDGSATVGNTICFNMDSASSSGRYTVDRSSRIVTHFEARGKNGNAIRFVRQLGKLETAGFQVPQILVDYSFDGGMGTLFISLVTSFEVDTVSANNFIIDYSPGWTITDTRISAPKSNNPKPIVYNIPLKDVTQHNIQISTVHGNSFNYLLFAGLIIALILAVMAAWHFRRRSHRSPI